MTCVGALRFDHPIHKQTQNPTPTQTHTHTHRSYTNRTPMGSEGVRVSTSNRPEISQSEDKASPRNPKEATARRSEKPVILLVWCLRVSACVLFCFGGWVWGWVV